MTKPQFLHPIKR